MKISKINLRNLFAKGQKPKQESFWNFIDSYWHKDEVIDQGAIKGLETTLSNKLDKGVETTLLNAFNDALKTGVSGVKGEAFPSSAPTHYDPATYPNGLYEKWDVTTAGTYVNFIKADTNPVEVTTTDLELNQIQIAVTNGVSKKLTKLLPQAQNKIDGWVAGNYSSGKQVIYSDQSVYEANADVTSSDVPGVSTKWTKKVGGKDLATDAEFKAKTESKAMSPQQLFDNVIGDFNFASTVIPVTMTLPSDFNINNANAADLPAIARFTFDTSLYSDFEYYTSVDVKFIATGTFNIYVYAKNNFNTPYQTIPVVVSSVGVKNVVFSSPIDASQYMIFVSQGAGYYVHSSTVTRNITGGNLGNITDVYIGMILYGTKTITTSTKKIIQQINEINNIIGFSFNNVLYNKKNNQIDSVTAESGNSSYNIGSSGLTISSVGVGNGVLFKQYNLSQRFIELRVKFGSDTKFYVGTQYVETNVGKAHAVIDSVAKTLSIYDLDSTSTVVASTNFLFTVVNNRDYIIRFYKIDNISKLEFIDTVTGERSSTQISQNGQFDRYKFGVISSTINPVISSISVNSILPERPFIGFYGDSITEGNTVGNISNTPYHKDRFANLIGNKLNKPYFVSGRGAGTIDGVLVRIQNELPYLRPNYVFITIGTNGGNTEAKLNQLVDFCESYGCKVILNLIPLYDSSTAAKNTMIQTVVDSRKLLSVKMNVATSVNADGVTKDNSLFANESGIYIHPNIAGNQKIYERSLIDIAEVYQEVGVY